MTLDETPAVTRILVSETAIDFASELTQLRDALAPDAGAVASFLGVVRGGEVTALELEHHPRMTEKSLQRIVDEAVSRWQLSGVTVVHRIGTLAPGDDIVLVLTASGHRREAFEACEFLMDYLKTEAVFWKRESRGERVTWVASTDEDHVRAQAW